MSDQNLLVISPIVVGEIANFVVRGAVGDRVLLGGSEIGMDEEYCSCLSRY